MTQKELLYVKTIADEKSISKAAKKLYIAQPSLSQAIQRIEDSLGSQLFIRTTKGLTLTYAGEQYYKFATRVLKMYEDFEIEISDINNLKTGKINIGITTHLATYLLPVVLPKFKEKCPNIEIHVIEKNSTELEQSLILGEVDFVIMHKLSNVPPSQINYETLMEDPFLIALSPSHHLNKYAKEVPGLSFPKIDLKLLADEPFIMLNRNQRIRQVVDKIFEKADINPKITLTLKNFETAKRLAAEGIGVTFVPMQYSKISPTKFCPKYYHIDENYDAFWTMCIATSKTGFLSKAAQCFLEILRTQIDLTYDSSKK